ncbi:ERF superfamily protein [Myxococcus virescens]|uniref:ERF superfamily protein n=1 Tax=Myxococcus virescens TaxID=83456 RepID=A0ABY0MUC1_9BACT|nr:ERF superfamily protein [Myxococcus virescens]
MTSATAGLVYHPPAEPQRKLSLVRKLAEVMGSVGHVPKSGRNNFHKYDYATEADIVAAVRTGMADRALMLIPTVVDTKWSPPDRQKDRLVTLTVRFTLHDGESGEALSFEVLGEGQDPGDKATYKALTGATKYALLKLFLIPTGDDPEQDDANPRGGQQSQQRTGQQGQQRGAQQSQSRNRQQPEQGPQGKQRGGQQSQPRNGQQPQQPPQEKQGSAQQGKPNQVAEQGERRTTSPASRDSRPPEQASRTEPPAGTAPTDAIGFGKHKAVRRTEAATEVLVEAAAEGEAMLKRQPNIFNAPALRTSLDAIHDELVLRNKAPVGTSAPQRATAAKCGFGPWKNQPISSMTDGELNAAVDMANEKLLEEPKAQWAPAMEANRDLLLAEISRRGMLAAQNGREPGSDG